VTFNVLMAATMNCVLWNVTPCTLVGRQQRYGQPYCYHVRNAGTCLPICGVTYEHTAIFLDSFSSGKHIRKFFNGSKRPELRCNFSLHLACRFTLRAILLPCICRVVYSQSRILYEIIQSAKSLKTEILDTTPYRLVNSYRRFGRL
jgi:hypothetical protein